MLGFGEENPPISQTERGQRAGSGGSGSGSGSSSSSCAALGGPPAGKAAGGGIGPRPLCGWSSGSWRPGGGSAAAAPNRQIQGTKSRAFNIMKRDRDVYPYYRDPTKAKKTVDRTADGTQVQNDGVEETDSAGSGNQLAMVVSNDPNGNQLATTCSFHKDKLASLLRHLRFILHQGLACWGHNESEYSSNIEIFLQLLNWLAQNNSDMDMDVNNAPGNCVLAAPSIQKEIINCCVKETTNHITQEIGDGHFAILADVFNDISHKEHLALCLRYVDKIGRVCERFLGVVHVADATSLSLKNAIETLLMEHSLSLSQVCGQGYDGASNMKGEIHDLKTLIMKESPSAYYIQCFAYQLQLVLVAVAKDNSDCGWFFEQVTNLLNIIGVSCKHHEMLKNTRAQELVEALELGEIESGQGMNQELGLARPGDTRWSSHYKTVLHIIGMYSTILEVLIKIGKDSSFKNERVTVHAMVAAFESFDFVFMANLMLVILGYTADLCQSLQKKDQGIVNAISLIKVTKSRLQHIRNNGWEEFFEETVTPFCVKHHIEVPVPTKRYVPFGRSKRFFSKSNK